MLAVAGDVHTPGERAVDWLAERFPGVPLVYVLGNHDHYLDGSDDRYTYVEALDRARDRAAARGVTLLAETSAVVAGVRFVGGTLWTDQRLGALSLQHAESTSRRFMRDYHRIRRRRSGRHRHLRVRETREMHQVSAAYLDAALAEPFDGPTVVVTHHAPSARSLDDPHMDLRWSYASDLEDLITRRGPDLWVHGHLHNHSDYQIGGTRVVANPRGYVEEARRSGFVPDLTVDL